MKKGIFKVNNCQAKKVAVIFAVFAFMVFLYIYRCETGAIRVSLSGIIAFGVGLTNAISLYQNKSFLLGRIFACTWELGFFFSLFKLSDRQFDYGEGLCLYFLIIGILPLLFDFIIGKKRKGISIKMHEKKGNIKGINLFSYTMFVFSLISFIFVVRKFGIFAISGERVILQGNGSWINVACSVFTRGAFYLASYALIVNKDKKSIPIIIWGLAYCLLTMTRSLLISFVLFFAILFLIYRNMKKEYFVLITVFVVVGFAFLGNLREGAGFSIADYAGMRTSSTLGWLYSYVCVNFDNLALQITKGTPTYTLSYFLRPLITTFDINVGWYDTGYMYVGHLNLGTVYRDYVCDMGQYAIFFFAITIIVLLLILYSRSQDDYVTIIRTILLSEIALAPMTNHFTISSFWLIILILMVLRMFNSLLLTRRKAY